MAKFSEWIKNRGEEEEKKSSSPYSKNDYARYRAEKSIGLDTFESDLSNVNTTLSSVLGGWQTQETMQNARTAVESMYKRTNDYQTYLSKYQPDTKVNLGDLSSYFEDVLGNWDSLASTYGQYKDADSYTKETTKLKELTSMTKDELASHLKDKNSIAYTTYGGQDITWQSLFDEKDHAERATSKEGAEGWKKYLADESAKAEEAKAKEANKKWYDTVLENYSTYDTSNIGGLLAQTIADKRKDTSYQNPTDEWTEEEQNIFGAYYLQDPEKAYEYATNVNNSKAMAKKEGQKQNITDSATSGFLAGAGHTIGSLASAPFAIADFLDDFTDKVAGRPIVEEGVLSPFEYSQAVQGGIGTHLNEKSGTINENVPIIGGKGLGDLYGVGTSIAQSALSGYALGGIGTMISYFGQGASAGIDEALARGASDEQAMLYGVLVGAGEGISEKIGVDNMFKLGSADTVKGFITNVLKQAGSEGIEEGISSIISEVSDRIVMQDKSVFENAVRTYMTQGMTEAEAKKQAGKDTFNTIAWDAVAGALSGGVHGGIQTSLQSGVENRMNKKVGSVIRENETMDDLKDFASEIGGDSYQKYIDLIESGKIKDAQLGKLFNEVESKTISDYNSEVYNSRLRQVADMAIELGDTKNSGLIASAVLKEKDGQELTREEKAVLKTDTAQSILETLGDKNIESKTSESINKALKRAWQVDSITTPRTVEEKAVASATKEAKAQAQENQTKVNEKVETEGREDISFYSESMEKAKAEAFNRIYDGSTDLESYANSFELAYTYGKNKIGVSEALKNKGVLTESQALKAYEAGNIGRAIKKQEMVDAINKKHAGKTFAKGKFNDSIIDYTGHAEGKVAWADLTERQKKSLNFVRAFAEVTGVNVEIITSKVVNEETGKRTGENGRYESSSNTIYIDAYAGVDAGVVEDAIVPTLSHEVTHWMKAKAPAMYQKMENFLLETLAENGKMTVNDMIAKQKFDMKYNHPNQKVTDELAIDELVARGAEDMLANSEKIRELLGNMTESEQKTFIDKVKEVFQNIIDWVNDLLGQYDSKSKEAELLRKYEGRMKELSKMWDEALTEAIQTNQSMQAEGITDAKINAITEKVGVGVDTETNSAYPAPQMSERTWTASEYVQDKETAVNALVKAIGVTETDAKRYIDNINSIAKLIADDRARLDYDPNVDDRASVLKTNKDYKWTVDMSTLCAKRLLFTGTFDAIQKKLPNTALDSDDIVALRSLMVNRGYEVACGICYVESTRRELGTITEDFIERYKLSQKTGKPITRVNSKGKVVELTKTQEEKKTTIDKSSDKFFADKNYTPTLAELNTTDIDKVKVEHPAVYEAYLNYMNARGQAKPKLLETRTEYKGEIAKMYARKKNGEIKDTTKSMNDSGGLRLQSFSDFEIAHLIDMMQITLDMSSVGLMSQAYTKVPAFAEVFGDTGIKINLSLIAKGSGLDENGNLIFDDVEGINHEEAFRLRDKYSKNVGTILVGKNDAHIIKAMADPRIDYIIPFHKSSWKESLYDALGLTGYDDYTNTQNEKPIDPDRKIQNFKPSEYWDYSKSGDENAKTYLEMCKADGRIPKFPQFQTYEGYWKLLIDFKMYDNDGVGSPQTAVMPNFDMESANRILHEYEGGHRKFPVAEDVVKDFVDNYKKEHPQAQYADRDSYAPTFYSQMGKVVSDIKQNKLGANDVIPYLRGKGVKAEEIKWSGIEEFLDGKKSVTKAELEEFVAGSMLQIEEETLSNVEDSTEFSTLLELWQKHIDSHVTSEDLKESIELGDEQQFRFLIEDEFERGNIDESTRDVILGTAMKLLKRANANTKWHEYTIDGGTNYRELLFKMPNSAYSNNAMQVHWDREGVLAHARIQDIDTVDGKMLFVEEIQSDWHNEGQKRGYYEDGKLSKILARKEFVKTEIQKNEEEIISRITEEMTGKTDTPREFAEEFMYTSTNKMQAIVAEKYGYSEQLQNLRKYHKELYSELRKLNGELQTVYNQTPDAPFHDNYHEYVLKRLIRMASEEGYDSIGWTTGRTQEYRWSSEYAEGYRIEYDQDIPKFLRKYGKKWGAEVDKLYLEHGAVWHMTIPDSMKNSVLYEGQAQYSDRDSEGNQLTEAQAEFFKDSKVRWGDKLMPVYHGTDFKFTEFKPNNERFVATDASVGFNWASKDKEYAEGYASDGILMKGYLNITNPLDIGDIDGWRKSSFEELANLIDVSYDELISMSGKPKNTPIALYEITGTKAFMERVIELGYDGVIAIESGLTTYGFINSNQFKNTTNTNPTSDADIRYSDRVSNAELAERDDTALYIKNTKNADYIGMIFNGTKTEETRSRRTLDAFIGKDFYVTDGKYVYGSIVLGEPHKYTAEEFHKKENQKKHRVPVGDEYDVKAGGFKWAYPIMSYEKFDTPKKLSDSKEYQNSFQARQVQYSDRDYTSVYELMGEKDTLDEENRKLKADIEKLKATIGSEDVKITRFRSLADYLKKLAGSNYSREALGDSLKELYNYIQTTDDLKWYNVMAKAEEIANDMMQLNVPINYFREVMTDIRQDKVSLSEEQYAEAVKLYGSYGNLHKALFGSINLTKSGKPLEEQWKDWSKAFPTVFKADISAVDMVKELRDTVDALKNTSAVMGEYERQEAIRHMGMEIYNQFWNIASDSSEAVRKERVAHREMMQEMRKDYEKRQAEKTLHPVGEVALKYEKLLKDTIKRDRAEMKRIRELGNKRMEEYKERAEVRATIQKITKNALTLNEWFVKNSKDKHIPEDMKGAVVQLITAIDFSSKQMLGIGGAEERRGQPTQKDMSLAKALSRLYEVADEMKDNQTEDEVFLDLDIPDSAVALLKQLSTKSLVLNQMTLEQLQALDVIVSTFKSAIIKANKNFVLAQNETRERTSNLLIHDADSLVEKKADNLATNFLEYANTTPYYMLKRLGRVGEQIFNALMDAQEQLVFLEEEIINYVKKTVDGKKIKQWSEEIHEIKILDGKRSTKEEPKYKTIKMTTAQIMSLYALEKRESAKLHLAGGGIRIANIKDGLNTIKDAEGSSLSNSELYSIIGRLTNEQKRVADALQKYMSETGAEWGNKVTMARWDIKQFGEENYFPMATVAQDRNLDDVGKKDNSIYRLLNMSFTKELTPKANNQLVIDNIFDVFSSHMTDMAKYTTHALPLLDTMKILGYSRKDFYKDEDGKTTVRHDTISVASSIRRAFGDNGYRYIINLLKDLNGVEITPRDEAITKTLMSNYKISAVGGNLRVALLQGSAFVKAGLVMNPNYLIKALGTNGLEGIKKAMKHSGIALWKSKGHYDLNIARSVASEIKQDENWMDKVREWSLKGAEWGDKITWGYLWNACELWAKENTPYSYNSAEFNKAVADKLREIIVKTQVVDSTMTRSQMMRGKSAMVQTLTAFMSESTMTYNMVADAFFEWSLDARKSGNNFKAYKNTFSKHGRKFATTASVYALTAFMTAVAGGFVDAVRDDDEEKEFDEKYLENLLESLKDNVNLFANLPILKDIVSIAQGYSPSRFDEQSFVNLVSGYKKWVKVAEGEGNVYSATYKTLQGLSQLTGLPVSNMMRDVVSMWNSTIGEMYPNLKIEQ